MESILKPKSKQHLEASIKDELLASHSYKNIAAQMQQAGFFGAQAFFEKEADAEIKHYMELRDFVNDMGDVMGMPALEAVDKTISSLQDALMEAYDMEKYLLENYQTRAAECMKDGDVASFSLFSKFVDKQVHSVGEFGDLIARLYKSPKEVLQFDEYLKEL
jgi:ferritin